MFDYEVVSLEQAEKERFQLLPDGQYEAVIEKVFEKVSSKGNPMLEVHLGVFDDTGKKVPVRDYIVFSKGMMWKVAHFFNAANMLAQYENKSWNEDLLLNKCVIVAISWQAGSFIPDDRLNGKAPGAKYPDKNIVEDYIVNVTPAVAVTDAAKKNAEPAKFESEFKDDDLPF